MDTEFPHSTQIQIAGRASVAEKRTLAMVGRRDRERPEDGATGLERGEMMALVTIETT